MIKKLFLLFEVWATRREGADLILARFEKERLIFSGTEAAEVAMQTQFGDRLTKKMGGYVLPDASWKEEYDTLHHGGFPVAIWI